MVVSVGGFLDVLAFVCLGFLADVCLGFLVRRARYFLNALFRIVVASFCSLSSFFRSFSSKTNLYEGEVTISDDCLSRPRLLFFDSFFLGKGARDEKLTSSTGTSTASTMCVAGAFISAAVHSSSNSTTSLFSSLPFSVCSSSVPYPALSSPTTSNGSLACCSVPN